ncbi:hypothetical protein CNR33_00002 [Pseudomonas phage tabernarius]|uniref:Uncharacterized protein n=1 Tax=Pseudomonas phage tabernarius TaxID=2048978 RepID=A0A2H4P6Q1_9CAUD|nr:hypothetical protein FDJ17_gp02 [Pseudomonas phage tabernarius]ATW57848.1 hypothetical protein CNR33_00002 [Pseudomonas phage tabernarius]
MAKRQNFLIKCSNGKEATKHTWNAARRHVIDMVREHISEANPKGVYSQQTEENQKTGKFHTSGKQYWLCIETMHGLEFTIEKQP